MGGRSEACPEWLFWAVAGSAEAMRSMAETRAPLFRWPRARRVFGNSGNRAASCRRLYSFSQLMALDVTKTYTAKQAEAYLAKEKIKRHTGSVAALPRPPTIRAD